MDIPNEFEDVDSLLDEDFEEAADYSRGQAATALPDPLDLVVPRHLGGQRLDLILAGLLPEHSRSRLQAWVKAGRVEVDAIVTDSPKIKLMGGERMVVRPEASPEETACTPEFVDFPVVYEDESLIVIDKPAGLVVHPGAGNWSGTLLNGLLHRYPETRSLPRAGIVHRLDKDTSGLMVVARTLTAQTDLTRQLQARTVKRQYVAVAIGTPTNLSGVIDKPIGRHPNQRTRMAVIETGKPAVTRYRVTQLLQGAALIHCDLETGRTHQIRVHLASIRLPLVGDPLYRGRVQGPDFHRQALHARRLGLIHPVTRRGIHWSSELPDDLFALIERLRRPDADLDEDDWQDDVADHDEMEVIYVRDEE